MIVLNLTSQPFTPARLANNGVEVSGLDTWVKAYRESECSPEGLALATASAAVPLGGGGEICALVGKDMPHVHDLSARLCAYGIRPLIAL